jgi:hypothetical protein
MAKLVFGMNQSPDGYASRPQPTRSWTCRMCWTNPTRPVETVLVLGVKAAKEQPRDLGTCPGSELEPLSQHTPGPGGP